MSFGQGNIEAVVKSSQIWVAGMQDLSKTVAATAQATFDESMSTFKAMTSVRSLKEAMELQASFMRATMEKTVAQSGQVAEAGVKLAEQTIAPLAARVTVAVEGMKVG